jgi:hypothetical protein
MKAAINKQHFTIFTTYQRVEALVFLRLPPRLNSGELLSRRLA